MITSFSKRRVHSSWHIAAASVGVVAGVVGSGYILPGTFTSLAWLLTGTGLVITGVWKARVPCICFAITGGMLVGV